MAATILCASANGQTRKEFQTDSLNNTVTVLELKDTVIDGEAVTDTLASTAYYPQEALTVQEAPAPQVKASADYPIPAIIATIGIFILPIVLVGIFFAFRSKKKREQYRLIEKAMDSGQPISDSLIKFLTKEKEQNMSDSKASGIKKAFVGFGLFIFLWLLTSEIAVGSIGLLVMFIGIGQAVASRTLNPDKDNAEPFIKMERDEATGTRRLKVGGIEMTSRNDTTTTDNPQNEEK